MNKETSFPNETTTHKTEKIKNSNTVCRECKTVIKISIFFINMHLHGTTITLLSGERKHRSKVLRVISFFEVNESLLASKQ